MLEKDLEKWRMNISKDLTIVLHIESFENEK
jgi:hypothetical protein